MYLFSLFTIVYLNMSSTECPLSLKIYPYDEIIITAEGKIAYSFANWENDILIELSQGSSKYGPYSNGKKVFGMFFEKDAQIKILNELNKESTFAIGCYTNSTNSTLDNENFNTPFGFQPVGKYSYNFTLTNYPILFTDDQGTSTLYALIAILFSTCIVIALYLFIRNYSVTEIFYEYCPFVNKIIPKKEKPTNNPPIVTEPEKKDEKRCFKKYQNCATFLLSLSKIISTIFVIFRIIQRSSATIEFQAKTTPETKSLFKWATDIVELIFNDIIPLEHLTEKDSLVLEAFAFYLAFPFIFLAYKKNALFTIGSLVTALVFSVIGYGFSLLPDPTALWFMFGWLITIPMAIACAMVGAEGICLILLIPEFMVYVAFKSIFNDLKSNNEDRVTTIDLYIGHFIFTAVFFIILTPIVLKRDAFCLTGLFLGGLYAVIVFFLIKKFPISKSLGLFIKGYQLITSILVIPIINNWIKVNNSVFGFRWQFAVYIIGFPILATFLFNVALVLTKNQKIIFEYVNGKEKFAILDITIKYAYAFCSGLDFIWACIGLEIFFAVGIVIYRPYHRKSDYVVNLGESFVVTIANFLGLFYPHKFSLGLSLSILIIAVLPVVISLYVYFIWEFGKDFEEPNNNIHPLIIDGLIVFTLISYIFYGLCFSLTYT